MKPIHNVCGSDEKENAGNLACHPSQNSNDLRVIVSDAWEEDASSQHYVQSPSSNEISGRRTGVLDFSLKSSVSLNSSFS
jgi:quinol monooxygenase YgiN